MLPKISIIIVTKNEEKDIPNLLESVERANYPKDRMEVIVVDDSTDKTPEIVKKMMPDCKFFVGENKGNGAAKNLGSAKATGEILLYLDADMVIDPDYILETAKCYEDKKVGGAFHVELFPHEKPNFLQKMLYLRKFIGWTNKPVCIRSVRREVYQNLGGFDTDFRYFDDWELGMRVLEAGHKIETAAGKVWHHEIDSWRRLRGQCRWMARSINFKRHKMNMVKKIGYSLLCASFPFSLALLFLGSPLNIAGAVGAAAFILLEGQRAVKIFQHSKDTDAFLMPVFDFILESFVAIGFAERIFKR